MEVRLLVGNNGNGDVLEVSLGKRQIPWSTVDIDPLRTEKDQQQYVMHNVADPRW